MPHPFVRRLAASPPVLYAILDTGLVGWDRLEQEARELAAAGVDAVQLRAKDASAGRLLRAVEGLLPVLHARGLPLIVNDRADVALVAGADGVHVGQDDLPPQAARALLGPDALVGFSTHSEAEVRAVPAGVDYLGFGAMFSTRTRENSRIAGVEALTRAVAATTLPTLAIGGLRPDNVHELQGARAAGIAVASALSPIDHHREAVAAFRAALAGW
jgi:thiamine-phosphate diphosphorylase